LNLLGVITHQVGENDNTVDLISKALSMKPDYAEAHFNQYATLIDPMDMAPSIESMQKAININPSNKLFRFMFGMTLGYVDRPQEAASHFNMIGATDTLICAHLDVWSYIKLSYDPLPPIIGSNIEVFKIRMKA
jgi:lipoprotein NlpI